VRVDLMKSTLKAPGSQRLILRCDDLLSKLAFNFNLCHHSEGGDGIHTSARIDWQGFTLVHFSAQPKPFWSVSRLVSTL